jgi:hypothetical protein
VGLGILCLETYWSSEATDARSVEPLVRLVEENVDGVAADHRHVPDRPNLRQYLESTWKDPRYDLLYLAAHGRAGKIIDENDDEITLGWIGARLEGSTRGRVVFLAGCQTAAISRRVATSFLERTGASALLGYERNVDWMESAQMDLVVLATLAELGPDSIGIWQTSPRAILEKIYEDHDGLWESLGIKAWYGRAPRPRRREPDAVEEALESLLELAEDEDIDHEERVRALRAIGALGRYDRRLGDVARARANPLAVRKQAVRAIQAMGEGASAAPLDTLRKRIRADKSDPGRESLLRLLDRA